MALSGIALVTGGAGFIGSHIAEALAARGASVRVIDNLSTGHLENIEAIGAKVDFIRGDLADEATVRKVVEDVEIIFHEAALPSVPRSVANPRETHLACVDGTFNILLAAKENRVRRLIYAASSSAYGDQPTLPKVESMRKRLWSHGFDLRQSRLVTISGTRCCVDQAPHPIFLCCQQNIESAVNASQVSFAGISNRTRHRW